MKKKKPLLTIGMIFKNEMRCLERCLKSLEPLRQAIPCEVVMADTGSTDGSREIAEKYADIVFDFPWIDDFGAARNAVIEQSSGEWFMTLDADEWLDPDIKRLAHILRHPPKDHHMICVKMRNLEIFDVTDDSYSEFYAVRVAHISIGIRYEGCIHESFQFPEEKNLPRNVLQVDTLVYHDGYVYASPEAEAEKLNRNMKLLRKSLEKNPDNLHLLSQCIDSCRNDTKTKESVKYVHHSLKVLHENWDRWSYYGAKTYRDALIVAYIHNLPELLEWAEKAAELYPDSIYTCVDVAYLAFSRTYNGSDSAASLRWGEMYRKGLAAYRAEEFDGIELVRGILKYFSPACERQMAVCMTKVYLNLKRYDEALSEFKKVDMGEVTEVPLIKACVDNLMNLQWATDMDISALAMQFWEQINRPTPDEETSKKRLAAFLNIAAWSLLPEYQEKEREQPEFRRHGYTVLLPLEGKCVLGDAAAIMETSDPAELAARVAKQDITNLPISALAHAMECGMTFPLPGQDLTLEEMDALAGRLATFDKFLELAEAMPSEGFGIQQLCWKRTLLLAGVRNCKWDKDGDMALAKAFVAMEREFLPVCYAQSALTEEGSILLPPLHCFGWYCTRAFDAFEAKDMTNYVHLLRKGLENCPEMKPMVEFLVEQLEKNDRQQDSSELLILAQQVRQILAQYAPDSPAVEEIKRSEAYQKVAYLLEDAKVIGFGGLPQ